MLLVLSDSGKLSFLTFCNEMHRFCSVICTLNFFGDICLLVRALALISVKFVLFFFFGLRFFPSSHVQLSNPGNSRHQVGRMLAVDSR